MHHVPIEVVGVGDAPMDGDVAAMARAAREAMTNAAKHSGAERVDVYAEVGDGRAEVFVRDRGAGFDPDGVAEDRMGIRGSIVGRVERHGGTAVIRSEPGSGTEVRLTVPVTEDASAESGGRR
ncbi:MAG: sensor histidine kinase, partial [Nocardioidaceae bacterium]